MRFEPVIEKTEAILLDILPQGETSAWLKWLSRDAGRLVTLAKGFHRTDSPFGGQAKELHRSEVVYYRRASGLHFLRETSLLDEGDAFAGDWRRMAAAGYAAGLVDRAIPPGDGEGAEFYPLLAKTLAAWEARRPGPAGILRFEAELLDGLGLLPHWEETPAARAGGAEVPEAVREAMERMRLGDGTLTALPRAVFTGMKDFLSRLLAEAVPGGETSPTPRDIVFSLLDSRPPEGAAP
jgi:hypothetical protein